MIFFIIFFLISVGSEFSEMWGLPFGGHKRRRIETLCFCQHAWKPVDIWTCDYVLNLWCFTLDTSCMEACTEMWTCACLQSSRKYICTCTSGSFLPCHSCTSGSPWSHNSRTWWNYMDRQWFRNQVFKVLYWSVSQRTIRINGLQVKMFGLTGLLPNHWHWGIFRCGLPLGIKMN